jgi:hypothetical protein
MAEEEEEEQEEEDGVTGALPDLVAELADVDRLSDNGEVSAAAAAADEDDDEDADEDEADANTCCRFTIDW